MFIRFEVIDNNERYRKARIVGIALAQETMRASKTSKKACVAWRGGKKKKSCMKHRHIR